MPQAVTDTPFNRLAPTAELDAEKISALILEMKSALSGASAMDFFGRMEENHNARCCWWPGQSRDGKKWPQHGGRASRLDPGQSEDIFPWPGGSDTRIRLVDTIIAERRDVKRLALQRKQERIGPRDMSPDDDPQAQAALWGQVLNYYDDMARWNMRTSAAQWADIAEEYGHSVLYVGWKFDSQVVSRTIAPEDLASMGTQQSLAAAEQMALVAHLEAGGTEETAEPLTAEQRAIVISQAANALSELVEDEDAQAAVAVMLREYDPEMPVSEARRVAKEIRVGVPVEYYASTAYNEQPEWRALTPFLDVFYPATTTRLCEAPWVAMTEWVSQAELESRVETQGYDDEWVAKVLDKGPGRSLELTGMSLASWVLSNGTVRVSLDDQEKRFQILHVYFRAAALGAARAVYHSVIHGHVVDSAGYHECCETEAGQYPFVEHVREPFASYLLASRGIGEISSTYVNEIKAQRDMRADLASITIKPPFKVPLNQAGGRIDFRPGAQIGMRSTAGMGLLEPIELKADPKGSMEVEATTLDSLNELWSRGPKVDPETRMTARQTMVSDFLEDVRRAKLLTFALCQQFAAEEIKAAFVGGLPVNLNATREQIQGRASLELDFDVTELDGEMLAKRMQAIQGLLSVDNAALILRAPLLKALTAMLLPASYKLIVADPQKQQQSEIDDESRILTEIVSGTQFDEQSSYQPGMDHASRLQLLSTILGLNVDKKGAILGMQPRGPDGQPSRAQKLMTEDPDVGARVANRLKFHAFQLAQQDNATTGRVGVEPVSQI